MSNNEVFDLSKLAVAKAIGIKGTKSSVEAFLVEGLLRSNIPYEVLSVEFHLFLGNYAVAIAVYHHHQFVS